MDKCKVPVTRRKVFYIPGFDPFPPRRYRELYRRESAMQAQYSGHRIAIAPARGAHYAWQVDAEVEGARTRAHVEVLVWSDIVSKSMAAGIAATYAGLVRTAWIYMGSGTLWRLFGLRKGPVLAALYPVAMLLAQLGIAALTGWIAARSVLWLFAAVLPSASGRGVAGTLALMAALAMAWAVLRGFRAMDGMLYAHYLMHDYAFSARLRGAYPASLETRLAAFGVAVADAIGEDWDEVLVVGHSSGAHLAVSVLADLQRAGKLPETGPALSLLTLGQVIPMVSFLPDAHRLRADLNLLAQSDALAWVDVSAPGDGCAFALCDPVAVSGVAPESGRRWPLVLSAAFSRTLTDATWSRLRWRFFRLHFQYLCAFDNLPDTPGAYDYFAVTAGPLTLEERFADRRPSRSRIDRAVSGHTSMAA